MIVLLVWVPFISLAKAPNGRLAFGDAGDRRFETQVQ